MAASSRLAMHASKRTQKDTRNSDVGPSPAKRTRQDVGETSFSVTSNSRLSQISGWFSRKSSSVSEHSLFKALSPVRLMSTLREKMGAPKQSTPRAQPQQTERRHYMQPHQFVPKPQSFATPDVRPKSSLPQPKFNDSIMSPGGHVAPPRAPRLGGNYGYQFDPSRSPDFAFSRPGATDGFRFRTAQTTGDGNLSRSHASRPGPHGQSTASNLQRTMYNKLYGRKGASAIDRYRQKMAAYSSVRMEEKNQYAELLRQYRLNSKPRPPIKVASLGADISKSTSQKETPIASLYKHVKDSTKHESVSRETFFPQRMLSHKDSSEFQGVQLIKTQINFGNETNTLPKIDPQSHIDLTSDTPIIDLTEESKDRKATSSAKESALLSREQSSDENSVIDLCAEDTVEDVKLDFIRSTPKSPINESLKKDLSKSPYATEDWITNLKDKFSATKLEKERIKHYEIQRELMNQNREEWESELEQNLRRSLALSQREPPVIDEPFIEIVDSDDEQEEDTADEFPPLTEEEEDKVDDAFGGGPQHQVLVEGFKLQLKRADIATLAGLNWLNDEVINFYMNMLMERGSADNFPSVHAFNTFFYPKIMSSGHAGVKRWTKRGNIDIFSKSYVLIPVHLGVHWCLAVIDFTKKEIRYYDSMGGPNNACLNALRQYLEDESMDKKKEKYSTADWKLINVQDIPQQQNGSDCGMFLCKFAEYVSRGAAISFSQEHMPYFRRRMVLEIITKKFLT